LWVRGKVPFGTTLWVGYRGHFVIPVFCFFRPALCELNGSGVLGVARLSGDHFGLLDGLDLAPVVRRQVRSALAAMSKCQKELVGLSVFCVASATALGDADKSKRFCFTDSRRNEESRYAV
jgi:hypothetical protein